jgi:hypothetical protein
MKIKLFTARRGDAEKTFTISFAAKNAKSAKKSLILVF